MMRIIYSLIFCLFFPFSASAQLWDKVYAPSPDLVATGHPGASASFGYLYMHATAWDYRNGGVIAYGITTPGGGSSNYLVKLNNQGDTIWTKLHPLGSAYWHTMAQAACSLSYGDFMIAGLCEHYAGDKYMVIRRFDSSGNVRLTRTRACPWYYSVHIVGLAAAPAGGYYVASSQDTLIQFAQTPYNRDSILRVLRIEHFDASDVLTASRSIYSGDVRNYDLCFNSLTRGLPPPMLDQIHDVRPASDGGLFCLVSKDTQRAFSPAHCNDVVKPNTRPGGGYVSKFLPSMQEQWSTDLQDAMSLPAGLQTMPYSAFATSDSGVVIVGFVLDSVLRRAMRSFVLRLDKNGQTIGSIMTNRGTNFYQGVETSNGQYLLSTIFYDTLSLQQTFGFTFLSRQLAFRSFWPQPLSPYDAYFSSLDANQYGGAFTPLGRDTSGTFAPASYLAGSVNFDSSFNGCAAFISGTLLADEQPNCSPDAGIDRPMRYRPIVMTNTGTGKTYLHFTNHIGDYVSSVPPGIYSVAHSPDINKQTECPGVTGFSSVNLSGAGYQPGFDFYDTLIPNRRDMKILLGPTYFVPGFSATVPLYAINTGSVNTTDTLTVERPSAINFVSAMPTPYSVSGNTITWIFNNVAADSVINISATFNTPAALPISTPLSFPAQIQNGIDFNPADNLDTLYTQVVGPYDPNCKGVNRPLYTTAQDDWLYTVSFQNTGDFPARDVIVTDKIDKRLDLSSFKLLQSSHRTTKLSLQDGNMLIIRFDGINLPDSMHNEPGSHGFITYMLRPKKGLKVGDSITNSASIYFDFNAPIQTDTTMNIISGPSNYVKTITTSTELSIYPNPADQVLNIESAWPGTIYLYDMQGRSIQRVEFTSGTTHVLLSAELSPGIYVLRGNMAEGSPIRPRLVSVVR